MSAPRQLGRLFVLLAMSALALQVYFVARIALMAVVDPSSTSLQRSEVWRLLRERGAFVYRRQWVDYAQIAPTLKRAVIASEDAGFTEHGGIDWDAIERAWEKNQRAQDVAERRATTPKLVGGSTITQQLAKNLFLSGERSVLRKGQEVVLTYALEALLTKPRILELYLNHVEWGEGLFGAQAAAQHYFRTDVRHLSAMPAARLAVMLPAPKRFERRPASAYILGRAAVVAARMPQVELP